jgi:hypothetical protein
VAALELAALVLPEADRAANHRAEFIELLGMDPGTVGQGRGRRAALILQAVLMALSEQAGRSRPAVARQSDADQRGESDAEARAVNVGSANDGHQTDSN